MQKLVWVVVVMAAFTSTVYGVTPRDIEDCPFSEIGELAKQAQKDLQEDTVRLTMFALRGGDWREHAQRLFSNAVNVTLAMNRRNADEINSLNDALQQRLSWMEERGDVRERLFKLQDRAIRVLCDDIRFKSDKKNDELDAMCQTVGDAQPPENDPVV